MGLEVEGIEFGYRRQAPTLRSIGFAAGEGRVLGLLGPNGSGKSTLIKLVASVLQPSRGSIRHDGVDLSSIPRRHRARITSYVPQEPITSFELTVRESVLLGRTPHFSFRPGKGDWRIVDDTLEELGLIEFRDRSTATLSGGQAQRVAVARALAQDTPVLLLDEPTSALDMRHQVDALNIVRRRANERGTTVVLTVHDLNIAARYCDDIAFLKDGELVSLAPAHEAFDATDLERIYDLAVDVQLHGGVATVLPSSETIHGSADWAARIAASADR